jgi:hypothetical protein
MTAFNREGLSDRFRVWLMGDDGPPADKHTFKRFDFFPGWQPV